MSQNPFFHVADTGPLILEIQDQGAILVITGATVVCSLEKPDGTNTTPAAVVSDGPNGLVTVTLVAGTFPEAGDYKIQAKITFADSRIKCTRQVGFHVYPKLGGL